MKVFVCYEENNHALAIECGGITDLTVFDTAEKAKRWFTGRVNEGVDDGFVMDAENDVFEGLAFDEQRLLKAIEDGWASITMYRGWQENWDESYAICVYEQEVQ